MSAKLKYILVDDDDLCNKISCMILEDAFGDLDIQVFNKPIGALEFIEKEYAKNSGHTILFLDINMPRIDGWQFLEKYDKFSEEVKQQINIYMLSSSINAHDKSKAEANKNVKGFVSKPLNVEILRFISEKGF
jgi:two-component system, chemotaxis family, chemotaxis protein CheY